MRFVRKCVKTVLFFCCLSCYVLTIFGTPVFADESKVAEPRVVGPYVDERFELVGIVFRLAGAREYQGKDFKRYGDAIDEHFAKFKNHRVIPMLKGIQYLTGRGVGYDAGPSLASHLVLENGRISLPAEDADLTLECLDDRWGPKNVVEKFVAALDDFYVESKFHDFFESQRELRETAESRMAEITKDIDFPWYGTFFGKVPNGEFRIVIFMVDENGGYGSRCRYRDGREDVYATSCVDIDKEGLPVFRRNWAVPLIVHEFNHSFCNPLIVKHLEALKPAADRLFPHVAEKMSRMAYGNPTTMLYEYLVRACEIRYLKEHGRRAAANDRLRQYRDIGFLWLGELVDALDRYADNRDEYSTLDDFMPEIVKLQNTVVDDTFIAKLEDAAKNRPKIIHFAPPNGAKNVDPSITEISVTFDRKMRQGYSWCSTDGHATFPPKVGGKNQTPAVWSEDGTVCTMGELALEPGKTYNIWINTARFQNFKSEAGIPSEPVHYSFTTTEK